MSNIKIAVSDAEATVAEQTTLSSGMVGATVTFDFSGQSWAALRKIAVFQAGDVQRSVEQSSWSGNVCTIPWECLQRAGERLLVGVYGMNESGSIAIPTIYADCGWIQPGADPSAEIALDRTEPFYAAFLADALAEAKATGVFDGPRGEKGDTGPKGDTGATGPVGPAGATGPKGDTGAKGEKGDRGDRGEDGTSYTVKGLHSTLSALQSAHPTGSAGDAWFVGTADSNVVYQWDVDQEAWVNVGALKGPKGDKGDTGDTGPVGPAGPQGEQGSKGDRGDTGDTGPVGPAGPQGEQGPKGDTGEAGPAGPKGDAGDTGPKGDKGETGPQGPKGDKGDKGDPCQVTALTVTLSASGWSTDNITVTATGVTAGSNVIVTPAPNSYLAYNEAAVRCTSQAANSLTFAAEETPTDDLTVNVLIL